MRLRMRRMLLGDYGVCADALKRVWRRFKSSDQRLCVWTIDELTIDGSPIDELYNLVNSLGVRWFACFGRPSRPSTSRTSSPLASARRYPLPRRNRCRYRRPSSTSSPVAHRNPRRLPLHFRSAPRSFSSPSRSRASAGLSMILRRPRPPVLRLILHRHFLHSRHRL